MNFKVIKLKGRPDVLLYHEIDEDSNIAVTIRAYSDDFFGEGGEMQEDFVIFNDRDLAKQYIEDFSEKTAIMFCDGRKPTN